jgi:hypothetical protein
LMGSTLTLLDEGGSADPYRFGVVVNSSYSNVTFTTVTASSANSTGTIGIDIRDQYPVFVANNSLTLFGQSSHIGVRIGSNGAPISSLNTKVTNNTIWLRGGLGNYGVYSGGNGSLISNNNITLEGTSSANGLFSVGSNTSIVGNQIVVNGTSGLSGFYGSGSRLDQLTNNTVWVNGTTTPVYGVQLSSAANVTLRNNTLVISGASPTGVYSTYGSPRSVIYNNITVEARSPALQDMAIISLLLVNLFHFHIISFVPIHVTIRVL